MDIDWTTFALEIVNFLALVWILKRFLYQPVLDTLAQRRARVEATLAEAREAEGRARGLQQQYEGRLADWEVEKAKAREAFEAALAQERTRGFQALADELAAERARGAAIDAHDRERREREQETRALAQAGRFIAALLGRVGAPPLEAQLVRLFLEDWTRVPESELQGMRAAATTADAIAVAVTSAFPLPQALRQALVDGLSQRLARPVAATFTEDPALLAGLSVSLGAWQLHLNFGDELTAFAAAANHDA